MAENVKFMSDLCPETLDDDQKLAVNACKEAIDLFKESESIYVAYEYGSDPHSELGVAILLFLNDENRRYIKETMGVDLHLYCCTIIACDDVQKVFSGRK